MTEHEEISDRVALLDLDGTVADYDSRLRERMIPLQDPNEPPYLDRYGRISAGFYGEKKEHAHIEARRKLIQSQPGFWRGLDELKLGFDIVKELRRLEFTIHVLTKGPASQPGAWSEKVEWCQKHLPDIQVNISSDKSLTYGRVLVDDFPPYFEKWMRVRPRGLVVCVAQPWNAHYAKGADHFHQNVLRYDGKNKSEMKERLAQAFFREPGKQ